ncbi:hypothetical protein J6590_027518 [Homalodisca vitripennis]|nr:hypothetical protein J6590_027518 [Homalodisca vitripennis]
MIPGEVFSPQQQQVSHQERENVIYVSTFQPPDRCLLMERKIFHNRKVGGENLITLIKACLRLTSGEQHYSIPAPLKERAILSSLVLQRTFVYTQICSNVDYARYYVVTMTEEIILTYLRSSSDVNFDREVHKICPLSDVITLYRQNKTGKAPAVSRDTGRILEK